MFATSSTDKPKTVAASWIPNDFAKVISLRLMLGETTARAANPSGLACAGDDMAVAMVPSTAPAAPATPPGGTTGGLYTGMGAEPGVASPIVLAA